MPKSATKSGGSKGVRKASSGKSKGKASKGMKKGKKGKAGGMKGLIRSHLK